VYNYANEIKKKKEIFKEEYNSDNMKECTFAPKTLNTDKTRTMQEFFEDQVKFQQKRQDNVAKIATENNLKIDQKFDPHPEIDENSRALIEQKRGAEPIYQRLYAKSKKPVQEQSKEEKKQVFNFTYNLIN